MNLGRLQSTIRDLFSSQSTAATPVHAEYQIRILSELTRAVGSSLEGPESAHRLITEAVTSLLNVERSILFLPSDNGQLQAVAASGVFHPSALAELSVARDEGIVGRAYSECRTVLVEDTEDPDFPLNDLARRLEVSSILAAPLKAQNEAVGVITADSPRTDEPFSAASAQVLEVFGGFAALVTSEARLIDELRRKNDMLESLFDVARRINTDPSPAAVLQTVLSSAIELTGATSGSLVFVDEERHQLVIRAAEGLPADVKETLKLGIGQGVTGWVARHGESVRIPDVLEDERYVEASGDVRAELAAPVRTGDRIIGVLNVDSSERDAFDDGHRSLLEALADLAATTIRLAFLEEQSQGEEG